MKLKEFLELAKHEHYRIYVSNRDCLLFESYFDVHSVYNLKDRDSTELRQDYWRNNHYCGAVYTHGQPVGYDQDTQDLLKNYGDDDVISIEISNFIPKDFYIDQDGKPISSQAVDPVKPGHSTLGCFNIFIK